MTQSVGVQRQVIVNKIKRCGLHKYSGCFNDLRSCQISKETSSSWRLLIGEEDIMAE
jgi:hypothetical protein